MLGVTKQLFGNVGGTQAAQAWRKDVRKVWRKVWRKRVAISCGEGSFGSSGPSLAQAWCKLGASLAQAWRKLGARGAVFVMAACLPSFPSFPSSFLRCLASFLRPCWLLACLLACLLSLLAGCWLRCWSVLLLFFCCLPPSCFGFPPLACHARVAQGWRKEVRKVRRKGASN